MSKIFGAEHFISDFVEIYDRNFQRIVLDEITKTIKYKMPVIKVDEQKLKDWIVLCARLEHIDKSDLVDIAVKKKIADKDEEIAIYKRALDLACEKYINIDGISYVLRDNEDYFDKSDEQIQKETIDYFVSQVKKELEEKDA